MVGWRDDIEHDDDDDDGDSDGDDGVGEMMLGRQPVYRRLQSSSRRGATRWAPICNNATCSCNVLFAI